MASYHCDIGLFICIPQRKKCVQNNSIETYFYCIAQIIETNNAKIHTLNLKENGCLTISDDRFQRNEPSFYVEMKTVKFSYYSTSSLSLIQIRFGEREHCQFQNNTYVLCCCLLHIYRDVCNNNSKRCKHYLKFVIVYEMHLKAVNIFDVIDYNYDRNTEKTIKYHVGKCFIIKFDEMNCYCIN